MPELPTPQRPLTLNPTQPTSLPSDASASVFELAGGHDAFTRLVAEFYRGVEGDPDLRALYPEEDLRPAAERLQMFLEQYWGGPHTYFERRGHPRLRMRHMPFAVTPTQRDRWLRHMRAALDTLHLDAALDERMWAYFAQAADFMVNSAD